MGQVLQKIKRAPNRIRAVVAGPPLVIGDEEPFVLSKPQSDESANLNDAVLAFPVGPKELFGLKFSKKHMTWAIKQPYADEALKKELDGINSMELMEHVNDTNVDWDSLLIHGVGYGGDQQFYSKDQFGHSLRMLIEYAEQNTAAAPDVKVKLRYITRALRNNNDAFGVLPMLATHGGVCNVMKEVGIRAAYGALASCSKEENEVVDVRNKVLQLLHDYRELRIEHLFIAQQQHGSGEVNTHSVVGYRNAMHKFVGLARIPDPDCPDIAVAVEYVPTFFARFYDMQSILGAIHFALNDRKIAYNAVVSFLQYNRPQTFPDAEDFLYHCFDDEGKFTRGAAAWLLFKIGVFKEVKKDSCDVNKLFPPLSELELSKSRDNVLAKSVEIVENLEQSLGKEEVEELAESNDWAVSHTCDNCRSHLNFY